jgi:hypothetical protein
MYKVGDRIEMVLMPDDPDPIPTGTQGTIDYVTDVDLGRPNRPYTQIGVKWDNGRTLSVCTPPDRIKLVSRWGCEW